MPTSQFPPVDGQDVSVVICCYTMDRWDDIAAAVRSVQAQDPPPGQLVVVVDHNDELWEKVTRELNGVDVVVNAEQQGLAGARNSGIAACLGSVIVFLDDDAAAEPGWLSQLLNGYAIDGVLGVGGGVAPAWATTRPRWLPPEFDWVVGCSYIGQPETVAPVRNFIGANMSLRREAFDVAGRFTHSLGRIGKHPAGCEETELCIRATRSFPGSVLLYEPAAKVRHRVTAERCTWVYFRRRCYAEGISKAVVAGLTGADAALATERSYVLRTLPRGIGRELRTFTSGDAAGVLRAATIAAGTAITAAGYARGKWKARRRGSASPLF